MNRITVTVVYALSEAAIEIEVELATGATVADAVELSGLAARHPEADIARRPVGVFGKRVDRRTMVIDGDRVEVYRPLRAEPKDARRKRAGRRRQS
jgi:putative ubiquitin-RnfH superfamily antitoxin RatB of RatAB toxin-antitoxin module